MITDYNTLEDVCLNCTKCDLYKTRKNVVFGHGNPNAEVMFIGEGPGANEDEQGKPFVGRSGKLLDKYLEAIDLDRDENIYISNMVKCRPPENRNPSKEETEECIGFLRNQFSLIKPKIIVCLGRVAACSIIKPDFKVTVEHGQWFLKKDTWFMGTFHPAALLRNPNNKPLALDDFLSLQKKIQEVCERTY